MKIDTIKRLLILFLCTILFPFKLSSQEDSESQKKDSDYEEFLEYKKMKSDSTEKETRKRESGNVQNSNWSIQLGAGYGQSQNSIKNSLLNFGADSASIIPSFLILPLFSSSSTARNAELQQLGFLSLLLADKPKAFVEGESYNIKFFAEYRPNRIGIQFGTSSGVSVFTYKKPIEASFNYFIFNIPVSGILTLIYLESAIDRKFAFSNSTLDISPTFHFRPRKIFDPYINAGFGFGICGPACNLGKLKSSLGLRINFTGSYIFLEREFQRMKLYAPELKEFPHLDEWRWNFGFGLYL